MSSVLLFVIVFVSGLFLVLSDVCLVVSESKSVVNYHYLQYCMNEIKYHVIKPVDKFSVNPLSP